MKKIRFVKNDIYHVMVKGEYVRDAQRYAGELSMDEMGDDDNNWVDVEGPTIVGVIESNDHKVVAERIAYFKKTYGSERIIVAKIDGIIELVVPDKDHHMVVDWNLIQDHVVLSLTNDEGIVVLGVFQHYDKDTDEITIVAALRDCTITDTYTIPRHVLEVKHQGIIFDPALRSLYTVEKKGGADGN